ncbi:hypothetical protein [Salmonella enterica]|uniref:Fimbrial protein n=3 Tax=Salmonella enterica TaxID=28901 RepID=A0A763UKQ4_SALER|nr:hypothetical protein [Salmonella enterica]EDA1465498.1 hypothetical protein [Salmonella enterica subsp. enterica serovar Chester]MCU7080806.1 hypothetical protein [Salmonella enterica]MCU7164796.1 hypothetical protein [Salmonella enterica]HAG4603571.1 hypothetical protein [Salmonella enterica]
MRYIIIFLYFMSHGCLANDAGPFYEYKGGSVVVELNGTAIYSNNFSGGGSVNYSDLKTAKTMKPPTEFKLETDLRGVKNYLALYGLRDRGRIHLNLHPSDWLSNYDLDEYTNELDGTIKQGRRWKDLVLVNGRKTGVGFVCGAPGTLMVTERDEEEITTWMRLTATGKDVNDEVNTFRVTCSYKWQRKSLEGLVTITPEVLNLSGDVGETVKSSFDVKLAAPPFQGVGVSSAYITWNRVGGGTSGCALRAWNKYNNPWDEGRFIHTSYNNLITMFVSVKSDTPQVCRERVNITVRIM